MFSQIILNHITPQAEEFMADEQAGFRQHRSTTEQMLNCRILMENIWSNDDKSIIMSSILRKPSVECSMKVCDM